MSLSENENLSVRIVIADYYLHKPIPEVGDQCYSAFRSLPVYRVPVIRIFGPTTEGVKTCVHIHGVFPYIFIPNWNNEVHEKDLYNFATCLDKAINTSFAYSNSKSSHVFKITQVSGKPFYGFHEGERNFLKIEFYNPAIVKRAADLLLNAAVFNTVFQPHEAHVPYILQFFIDNNLYGMNNVSFSSYSVRKNDLQNDLNIDETVVLPNSGIPKQSYSKLEVDTTVSDLCNPFSGGEDVPNNPGLAFIWEEEKKHRRFNLKSSQITPNQSQQRPQKPITRTEIYFREKLDQKLLAIKDNANVMDMDYDNTPSLNSTYEELNTQSRSLLEILENLVDRRENTNKEEEAPGSGSSSPSLVYSDDENNVANISAISSQPVLRLRAEEDSILGNNFSDEENDIDDNDHKVLSQSLIYTRPEHFSSDDSDSDPIGAIPQLDGAHDIHTSSSKNKTKKCPASKRGKSQKPPKQELKKTKKNNQSISTTEKTYNLRSRGKNQEDPKPNEKFKPKDFKIVLNRLDTKTTPKKSYPRLNIDVQKSPKSSSSKLATNTSSVCSPVEKLLSSDPRNEPLSPSLLENPHTSTSTAFSSSNTTTKNDKRLYPQLQVDIKKSPRSMKPVLDENISNRASSGVHGLKKRKINFEGDVETTKLNDTTAENSDFLNNKWKKSLKRRKNDDMSFKIGDSFSLLEFRKSKYNRKNQQKSKLDSNQKTNNDPIDTLDINSQGYSLRLSDTPDSLNHLCNNQTSEITSKVESAELKNTSPSRKSDKKEHQEDVSFSGSIADDAKPESIVHSGKLQSDSDDSLLAMPLSETTDSKLKTENYSSSKFQPTLIIPRVSFNATDTTAFPPTYENSLIELDIPESPKQPLAESLSQNDTILFNASSTLLAQQTSDLVSSQTLIKNSENSLDHSSRDIVIATLPAKLSQVLSENRTVDTTSMVKSLRDDTVTEIDVTKINENPGRKKRLGMKIRKRIKPETLQLRARNSANSSQNTNKEEVTSSLPVQTKDTNDEISTKVYGISAPLPEPYIDHSVRINTVKCDRESSFKRTKSFTTFRSRSEKIVDLVLSQPYQEDSKVSGSVDNHSRKSPNYAEVAGNPDSGIVKPVNEARSPERYENSDIELHIHQCSHVTQNDNHSVVRNESTMRNEENTDLATVSKRIDDDILDESVDLAIPPKSPSPCEEINIACSDDSLLNVLDALSPESNAALNRRLDSIESQDLVTPQSAPPAADPDLRIDSAPKNNNDCCATSPNTQPKSQSEITRDFPSDDQLANNEYVLSVDDDSVPSPPISAEPCSPSILDQTQYAIDDCDQSSEAILFEEDSLRLDLSPTQYPCEPVEPTKLNNDIWDCADSDRSSDLDNEIQSFYHDQTCTPSHITVIRDLADEDSSPIAKSLTPQSVESNEILSFYVSQSPDAIVCSISEELKRLKDSEQGESSQTSKSDPSIVECSQSKISKRPKRNRKSPSLSSLSLPHSTPRNISAKKTPSPTYTPILKKLMLKKVNKENDKRRISSQRFHSEPFLPEIREEDEKKSVESDGNTSLSLPVEIECDRIKTGKPLNTSRTSSCSGASYQIEGPTLENACGFRMNLENLQDVKRDKQYQFITLISMEVFAQTRGDLKPDPEYDAISCLFYSIHHDAPEFPRLISGIISVDNDGSSTWDINRFKCDKIIVQSEAELFEKFLALIRKWDPDMFIGYEVEMLSWGYLIQRSCFLGLNYSPQLSRVRESHKPNEPNERPVLEDDEYSNEIKLPGRIVLNVWRLMRHEVTLQSYTFENILYHVQHQRVPFHTHKFLTECWKNCFQRWTVIDYFLLRTESNITLLEQLDFIGRTSELARLFGIQFYEVLSRGSQFRVESMMLRLAKTQNYVAVSPSVRQRFNMRAPECLPLIMEPESKFYTDPVIVLDFQSLYPSIIIAYNYCFSTCLGRIEHIGQSEAFHFGCVEHKVPPDLLLELESSLNLSPAGVAFVDETVRKGILPSMLEEILETRLMVKKSMKENKDNRILKRVLHARQLGLKLIANVTYGYTSANFSGRMPCVEIADSVVSKGRETLERAIELVNNTKKWGARVVYGDTDSLFVLVPNQTKEEAFRIGAEIADAVTNENPKPVKLKFEKVYLPCMLQTKKRYVGFMYESVDQEKPVYDAKGIETVRRDGCPAVSKILEKSLKILFETRNVNTVKQYVQRQFTKLISGRISIQELTFAREYRGMSNYKPAACVPALQIAKQALLKDRRAEPRIKERVKYVITSGPPGVPLIRLVRTPQEFLDSPGSLINTEYYITRVISPALERCFILMNVSVIPWYNELPKKQKMNLPISYEMKNKTFKKTTISHYFSSSKCLSCLKMANGSVCQQCQHKPQRLALTLGNMINEWQRKRNNIDKICRSCSGRSGPIECSSLDCPIYYVFQQSAQEAEQVRYAEDLRRQYLFF